jgi:hypothetical protein
MTSCVKTIPNRTLLIGFVVAFFLRSAFAGEVNAYFSKDDHRMAATINYSECADEGVAECISYSVTCNENSWFSPEFVINVGPVDNIASSLTTGMGGAAGGQLLLSQGWNIALEINVIEFVPNELDGGWRLTLRVANGETMIDALTPASTENAALEVAGERFLLTPQPGDGAKLMNFKSACSHFRGRATDDAGWTSYRNARFGFWIDVPPGFSAISEAQNGDGGTSMSKVGNAKMSVWGSHILEGGLATEVTNRVESIKASGWKIAYEKRSVNWASWSGINGGRVMYQRGIALCGARAAFFLFEYDFSEIATQDPIIERLVTSFKPDQQCR